MTTATNWNLLLARVERGTHRFEAIAANTGDRTLEWWDGSGVSSGEIVLVNSDSRSVRSIGLRLVPIPAVPADGSHARQSVIDGFFAEIPGLTDEEKRELIQHLAYYRMRWTSDQMSEYLRLLMRAAKNSSSEQE